MSAQNNLATEKFKNKYRVPSARLSTWDYAADGYYSITICTANREHFFGEIKNGTMELNHIGQIVECEWQNTEKIRQNAKLDEFVIMPNHLHGIVVIDNSTVGVNVETRTVETHCNASLQLNKINPTKINSDRNPIIYPPSSVGSKAQQPKKFMNLVWRILDGSLDSMTTSSLPTGRQAQRRRIKSYSGIYSK